MRTASIERGPSAWPRAGGTRTPDTISAMQPTAVITGASSGIGAATAVKLAEAGYHVVLAPRRAGRVEALAGRLRERGGQADAPCLDVTGRAAVHALAASLGRCDGHVPKGAAVYAGVREPLTDEAIADAVAWTVTRPSHANIDLMVMRPGAQAAQHKVYREAEPPRT